VCERRIAQDGVAGAGVGAGAATAQQNRHRARAIFAAVRGAQLVARSRGDVSVYEEIVATYRGSGLIP
jgi:TetR/AcrR family transcriptional regulator, transcriptional repressor for nem operon